MLKVLFYNPFYFQTETDPRTGKLRCKNVTGPNGINVVGGQADSPHYGRGARNRNGGSFRRYGGGGNTATGYGGAGWQWLKPGKQVPNKSL